MEVVRSFNRAIDGIAEGTTALCSLVIARKLCGTCVGARNMYKDAGFRHVAYEPQYLQFLEGRVGSRLELMLKRL